MSGSYTRRRRRPINIEESAMKLLLFLHTLLNKQEKKDLKKEVKDIGKKNNNEIVDYMNGFIVNQQGGAGSSIGGSKSSLMIFVLLLVSLLYLNTRVGANTLTEFPVKTFPLFPILSNTRSKSLDLDHFGTWITMMGILATPSGLIPILEEVEEKFMEGEDALQKAYPKEMVTYQPFLKLFEAAGCTFNAPDNAPYSTKSIEMDDTTTDVRTVAITDVNQYFRNLNKMNFYSNEETDTAIGFYTRGILNLPKQELNKQLVCKIKKEITVYTIATAVSKRLEQGKKELNYKFTVPNSKDDVKIMWIYIQKLIARNPFIVLLVVFLKIFGLGYLIFNKKIGKSKTVNVIDQNKNNKNVNVEPKIVNGLEMLQNAYKSSSEEEKAPILVPAINRTTITANVNDPDAKKRGLPLEFGSTKGKGRSASRGKRQIKP